MKSFNKKIATVFTDGKHHKIMLPSGEIIPHLVETITTDNVEFSKVTMTMICNVVETKEEALSNYSKSE